MKVCFISTSKTSWAIDLFLVGMDREVFCPRIPDQWAQSKLNFNLYELPFGSAEVLVISSECICLLLAMNMEVKSPIEDLRKEFNKIVLLDVSDTFELHVPPEELLLFDSVIKCQGVYKDRDLYNFKVGTRYPGGNWTEKINMKNNSYSVSALEKIYLGPPCFLSVVPEVRRKARKVRHIAFYKRILRDLGDGLLGELTKYLSQNVPKKGLHFVGSMTHVQRLELVKKAIELGMDGEQGITSVPEHVYGIDSDRSKLTKIERQQFVRWLKLNNKLINRKDRLSYLVKMSGHKAILALCGYGELTFRHGEAMSMGRTLICQDLTHVDVMFDFTHMKNCIFLKPDLTDAWRILEKIIESSSRTDISDTAFDDWGKWSNGFKEILNQSFDVIIRM